MLKPKLYSLNYNAQKPVYDYNDIIEYEASNIEVWLNRDDIIVIDFSKFKNDNTDVDAEFQFLNKILLDIDKLEEEFKIK